MPVTPKEFENRMTEISRWDNQEERHIEADKLMVETLNSLGYSVGTQIFDDMLKWYA